MVRWAPILLLSTALGGAPFQCASDPDPKRALEETPGEALYDLADEFKKRGDQQAWRETLEHIIERYPASRFAASARRDLDGASASSTTPPQSSVGGPSGDPSHSAAAPK